MRWVAAVASVVALVGCDTAGVNVEVIVKDPSITRVELFVGRDCRDNCPGAIAPPMIGYRDATGYLVNDSTRWQVKVEGGVARFRIAANPDEYVPIVVAVGVDDQLAPVATATLYDLFVSANKGVYWRLELAAASPIADLRMGVAPPDDGTEGVALWRTADEQVPACLLVEHWRDGGVTREFIVPEGDTDCDGAAKECDPFGFLVSTLPTIQSANCLVPVPGTTGDVCMLGGPACSEAGPTAATCKRLDNDYCVSQTLCGQCAGSIDDTCVRQTIVDATTNDKIARLACDVPIDTSGAVCSGADKVLGVNLLPILRTSNPGACLSVKLVDLDVPFDGNFKQTLPITMGSITVKNLVAPCKVDIVWSGTYSGGTVHARHLAAAIELSNGKHIVVPFNLNFGTTVCNGTPGPMMGCLAYPGTAPDSLYECVAPVGSCAPSPTNGCPTGVACGQGTIKVCCNPGETCSNNVCKCGVSSPCVPGQTCATAGPISPGECGTICCGGAVACPL